jgi:hypothetical protein
VTQRSPPAHHGKHLDGLVARIATGDRSAIRTLYAFLAIRVWRDASRLMPLPADSQVITRSTFVAVWHLAKRHVDGGGLDTEDWIAGITAREVDERLRAIDTVSAGRADDDRHTYREFAAIFGAGRTAAELAAAGLPTMVRDEAES